MVTGSGTGALLDIIESSDPEGAIAKEYSIGKLKFSGKTMTI